MLGNLFDGDGTTMNIGNKFGEPPEHRGNTGLCGIKNQGATCYLNSLLQTLFFTPEFRDELFKLNENELGYDEGNSDKKPRVIPFQLQLLFCRLLHLNANACDTESLTKSFGWVDNEHFQQHDVQELSRILFDAITESLKGTSGSDIIKNLYSGSISNRIICEACGNKTERVESFLDLTIAISNRKTLANTLSDMFIKTESMIENNQYFCENCNKLRNAEKIAKIKTLPNILVFSLLRFNFDYKIMKRFKENGKFKFPLQLNMEPYVDETGSDLKDINGYELYSIIIHSGNAYGGHYHAYIRDVDNLGKVPDDYSFINSKFEDNLTHFGEGDHSSITKPNEAIACVLAKLGGTNISLDVISESFREECGSSWGKLYRKDYGTMLKYIVSQSDIFDFNKALKKVSLKSWDETCELTPCVLPEPAAGEPFEIENTAKDSPGGDVSEHVIVNGVSETSGDNDKDCTSRPLSDVWFDFNDSQIRPVTFDDIQNQYEGKESAYMLFYRKKSLKRSFDSLGNKDVDTKFIKSIIDEENVSLKQSRIAHALHISHISLHLYLPCMFEKKDGVLKMKKEIINDQPSSVKPLEILISKKSNAQELRLKIEQVVMEYKVANKIENVILPTEFVVNNIKFLAHNGMHIYETLDFKNGLTIENSEFANNQLLLAWNGCTVANTEVKPGSEFEPIKFEVVCKDSKKESEDNFHLQFDCVEYSKMQLKHLCMEVITFLKIKSETFKVGNMTSNGNASMFSESEVNESVGKLFDHYTNTIILLLDLSDHQCQESDFNDANELEFVEVNIELDDRVKWEVLNDFNTMQKNITCNLSAYDICAKLKVCNHTLLSNVKKTIAKWFCIQDIVNFSLHNKENNIFPMLDFEPIGSDLKTLVLKKEKPISRDSICVIVLGIKGTAIKNRNNLKFNNAKKCFLMLSKSVAENTLSIVSELKLDETKSYHLRYVINEKEFGAVIDQFDEILSNTDVVHGSKLLICEGTVLLTGCIRIPVWKYPCNPILNFCNYKKMSLDIENSNFVSPHFVDYVEVSKDASLFDLRHALQKLNEFKENSVEEICVRNVFKRYCTKLYNVDATSIKRMKFGATSPIAVQIRKLDDELLSNKTVLLNLLFHLPGTRIYSFHHELQWDTTKIINSLSEFISSLIGYGNVTVAKFNYEFSEWQIIKATNNEQKRSSIKKAKTKKGSQPKKNKSKSTGNKKDLDVNDGDIIGIKINILEEIGPANQIPLEDFDRDEDITTRKLLNEEINIKKNKSTENVPKKENKEAALKIYVDTF